MAAKKLLIADSSEEFSAALRDALRHAYQIRIARDGNEALALLEAFRPDVLALDLILPGLDGITLLQTAIAGGHRPMVLATSIFFSDYVIQTLTAMGIGYIIRKPCPVRAVADRLLELHGTIHPPRTDTMDPKAESGQIMLRLSFKAKWHGYSYLKEAIALTLSGTNPSITKEIYPAIAVSFATNPKLVERSIRTAIETAWLHRDNDIWRQYFPPGANGEIPRPTNADFVARLAEYIRYH